MKCTFAASMQVLRRYASRQLLCNQQKIVDDMFASYLRYGDSHDAFDGSSVSRWVTGARPVSMAVGEYYSTPSTRAQLTTDICDNILPGILDVEMMVAELREVVMGDTSISVSLKRQLLQHGEDGHIAEMVADIIAYTLQR